MDFSQVIGSILSGLGPVRGILGFILVLLLPGFAWSLVFFTRVNILERLALSFGLSIAIVTLSILVLNVLIGVRISGTNALIIIAINVIIPLAVYYLKRLTGRRSEEE